MLEKVVWYPLGLAPAFVARGGVELREGAVGVEPLARHICHVFVDLGAVRGRGRESAAWPRHACIKRVHVKRVHTQSLKRTVDRITSTVRLHGNAE